MPANLALRIPAYLLASIVGFLAFNGLLVRFDGVPADGDLVRTGTMTVTSCTPSLVHLGIVMSCSGPVTWDPGEPRGVALN
ncbi:MAG: hypothetical protein Q4G45_11285, partial [Actinomycetia bacterium]|nr:hypothetical protein [Actinomycetes bacterium]